MLIPLAINTGFYIEYLIRSFKTLKDKKETIVVYFNFGLTTLIAILFPATAYVLSDHLSGYALVRFIIASLVIVTLGVSMFRSLKQKELRTTFFFTILFMVTLGFLALPLNKLQVQQGYRPVSEIHQQNADQLPLYSLDYVAPEAIWNYGEKIPGLNLNDEIVTPSESEFLLLSNKKDPNELPIFQNYKIEVLEQFDLNTATPGTRSHRKRLVNQLYRLKKL